MLPSRNVLNIIVVAALLLLVLFIVNSSILLLIFGFALALVAPGYLITKVFWPRQLLGIPERIVLSIGVSLSVDALGGLLLDLTPWGLQAATWFLLLGGISLLFLVIGIASRAWERPHLEIGLGAGDALMLAFAALILITALAIALTPAASTSIEGYTNLWIVPSDVSDQRSLHIAIKSDEVAKAEYSLQIKLNGQVVSGAPSITLGPGESWEGRLALPAAQTGAMRIEANLYRADKPQAVYRQVVLNR
jgi:hypothetical protein